MAETVSVGGALAYGAVVGFVRVGALAAVLVGAGYGIEYVWPGTMLSWGQSVANGLDWLEGLKR